jgi:translation initiation factor IF-3
MTRINHRIRVPEVLLIDVDGTQIGVVETRKAQIMARDKGLDLVEVASTSRPPVCRIMDYGKFKYEQGKKERGSKKSGSTRVKEIKFHANVGEHDYLTKVRRAHEFLGEGHRVKCSLYFRGRENDHREFGFDVMNRVKEDCKEFGVAEHEPRMMGRNLIMMIAPSKNKSQAKVKKAATPTGTETAREN